MVSHDSVASRRYKEALVSIAGRDDHPTGHIGHSHEEEEDEKEKEKKNGEELWSSELKLRVVDALTLKCPGCDAAFFDLTGCAAANCSLCGCHFCWLCLQVCPNS